jgi:hypothetical protein
MKLNARLLLALVASIGCFAATESAKAGDLSVDNITVGNGTTGGNATGVLPTKGTSYVMVEQLQGDTSVQRGQKLLAAYAKAKGMSPSINNRITVLIPPGEYDLASTGITLDTSYVDLVGVVPVQMTRRVSQLIVAGDPSSLREWTDAIQPASCVVLLKGNAQGVLKQTASHVRIANLSVLNLIGSNPQYYDANDPAAYFPNDQLTDVVVEHVWFRSSSAWAMRMAITYSGVFRDCYADGQGGFGCVGTASGTFEDCVAYDYSFGSWGTAASGTFRRCSVFGWDGFGGGVQASGIFEDCYAQEGGFGGDWGVITGGRYINCVSGDYSFGNGAALPSTAVLIHCKGGVSSFGPTNPNPAEDFNYSTKPTDMRIKINPQGDLSMGSFTQ